MSRIEGLQDPRLEFPEEVYDCPQCLDERLVRLASTLYHLVCPSCDLVVRDTLKVDDTREIRWT